MTVRMRVTVRVCESEGERSCMVVGNILTCI